MDWLQPTQALSLLLIGAGATYLSQRRIEQLKAEQQKLASEQTRLHDAELRLREERRRTYLRVLDPYIEVMHAMGSGSSASEAQARLRSVDHRKAAFELKLVGTDEVVRTFNVFARHIVDAKVGAPDPPGLMLRYWAEFLHAIRKNVGDPDTTITEREMIIDWVSDIDTVFPPQPTNVLQSRPAS